MAMAVSHSVALDGMRGHIVEIEADLAAGLAQVILVGLPDASLGESRDRCRAAVTNSGQTWPATKITIALSPAVLPKFGSHYDLGIALTVLAASGALSPEVLSRSLVLGELALDGRLRAIPGVLPATLAGIEAGWTRVIVPEANSAEAALVEGVEVIGVRSLRHAIAVLRGDPTPVDDPPVPPLTVGGGASWCGTERLRHADMRDVVGQVAARVCVLVAAAGGHHLLLDGPPGVGKTMLAERLPGLLPDLPMREALEVTAVHSVAGVLADEGVLLRRPPFLDPHHSATKAAIIGGGTKVVRPGAMSLAHRGVLFLDEAPEFNRDVMEALRQPLESGRITIARAAQSAEYPARFQLVLAANPCPCGQGASRSGLCTCTPTAKRKYADKVSGPVRDRIDIRRTVDNLSVLHLRESVENAPDTATLATRVVEARARQSRRYADTPWRTNVDVPGAQLRRRWPLQESGANLIDQYVMRNRVSARAADRVVKLAWTVADLLGADRPGAAETRTALSLRLSDPLDGPLLGLVGS